MLTDQQARELLAAAADTIEVAPEIATPAPVRRWPTVVAAAAAVAVLAVLAGTAALLGSERDSSPRPAGTTTPTAVPTHAPAARVTVPDVVGMPLADAVSALEADRLTVSSWPEDPCASAIVISQYPPAGATDEVDPGEQVSLSLGCRVLPGSPTSPAMVALADDFVAYARGDRSAWHDEIGGVAFHLGGRIHSSIDHFYDPPPQMWEFCPGEERYANHPCPYSAAATVAAAEEDDLRIAGALPDPPCGLPWTVPPQLVDTPRVTITGGTDCADWFAVTLFQDGENSLQVDLTLADTRLPAPWPVSVPDASGTTGPHPCRDADDVMSPCGARIPPSSATPTETVRVPVHYVDQGGMLVVDELLVDASRDRTEAALALAATAPADPTLRSAVPPGVFTSVSYDGWGDHSEFGVVIADRSALDRLQGMTPAEARTAIRAVVCTVQMGGDQPVRFYLEHEPVPRLFGQRLTEGLAEEAGCPGR